MEMSIAMYSRRRDIIVLVSKYRRRVVTKQMLFQLQELLQNSERKPSASSGGMNLARGEAMLSAIVVYTCRLPSFSVRGLSTTKCKVAYRGGKREQFAGRVIVSVGLCLQLRRS